MNFKDLTECEEFLKLKTIKKVSIKEQLTPERINKYKAKAGAGLTYSFAGKAVNDEIINSLQKISEEQELINKFKAVLDGEVINTGEKRSVLHHLTRGTKNNDVVLNGQNMSKFYETQKNNIYDFVNKVHSGEIVGSTGIQFDTVVQIGIGGSDLGPKAIYLALKNNDSNPMEAHFISNVDPDDANAVLAKINFESTLFVLVSKSGTTQETLTNQMYVINKIKEAGIPGMEPLKHFVAVTSETSPLAKDENYLASFFIDDNIGGRFSSTSAVGGVILSLSLGADVFESFLNGANKADIQALNTNILENAALLDALIGMYENNILGYTTTGVIPYGEALSRFPAHLQQADMESNGKSVNRYGKAIDYKTGPIIFGEPGTNSQHSFFQFIHQGKTIVPLQFIGFKESQMGLDREFQGATSHKKLNANLVAQMTALGTGKDDSNLNKKFDGERPTSLLFADKLTPEIMGGILAHYENKIMFQGFLWNINSFDQEGVQLGKVLANKVLDGSMDPTLKAYSDLLL